jgi:hypothetical protein
MIDERALDVNEHGVLRIPGALWLSLVLQCRHVCFGLMLLFSAQQAKGIWHLLGEQWSFGVLLIEVPALVAFFVTASRRPEAGRVMRALWPWVAHLIAISALAHVAYTSWYLWNSTYWTPWPELAMVGLMALDVLIVMGVVLHPHWRAVWAEFPAAPSQTQTESSVG